MQVLFIELTYFDPRGVAHFSKLELTTTEPIPTHEDGPFLFLASFLHTIAKASDVLIFELQVFGIGDDLIFAFSDQAENLFSNVVIGEW